MMPVQSHRQGDDLLVDNVDLKRAARNFLNKTRAADWTPPRDLNQAMELMAACFGYANLLAANRQAGQTPVATDAWVQRSALREPRVLAYVADARLDDDAHARALMRASRPVAGETPLVFDMSDFDAVAQLRQFWKRDKPAAVVCDNVELGVNSRSSDALLLVMVNHPDVEFRLLFRTEVDATAFFHTWVYQDDSPAISAFTVVDSERPGRIVQLRNAPADSNRPRARVAYPPEFHAFLRANRRPGEMGAGESAERYMADRAMTDRSDGPRNVSMGQGTEDLKARRGAFAPGSPELDVSVSKDQASSIDVVRLPNQATPRRKPRP